MPRIVSLKPLERSSEKKEANKKYFFALEGTGTEVRYIKYLISQKRTNCDIFYFYRKADEGTSNNLLNITNTLSDVVEGSSQLELLYRDLPDLILDNFASLHTLVNKTKLQSKIDAYVGQINKNSSSPISVDEIPDLVKKMKNSIHFGSLKEVLNSDELINIIHKQSTFDQTFDRIIIIGDRDKRTFTKYKETLDIALSKNMTLIISNPCIEFWFLIHFTNCSEIDMSEWQTSNNAASLVYDELKKYDEHYGKTTIDCEKYYKLIDAALKNASLFEQDVFELENKTGTRFPFLIDLVNKM